MTQLVSGLSGGERARLLLAKLMLSGANLLFLDEPTNDLDFATLGALEEALCDFGGSVVIISHDRAFLDRVATHILSFEGEGKIVSYADRQQAILALQEKSKQQRKETKPQPKPQPKPEPKKKKLSYREQQELKGLPEAIETAEEEQERITEILNDPESYKDPSFDAKHWSQLLESQEEKILEMYDRWEELCERS